MNTNDGDSVARYYDVNTGRFLRFGQGSASYSIHRAVWGEGVRSRRGAMNHVDELVRRDMIECRAGVVLDLGCGVGGSMLYLAAGYSADFLGITVSRVQTSIAKRLFAGSGLEGRCRVVHGDFLDSETVRAHLPKGGAGTATLLAFGIESFNHVPQPDRFFRVMGSVLKRGDRLVLCDDFLAHAGAHASPVVRTNDRGNARRIRRWLSEYRRGWKIRTLLTSVQLKNLAASYGFEQKSQKNLTPYLELNRPRDLLIRGVVAMGRRLPLRSQWWDNLLGGNALQRLLESSAIEYHYLVFEKSHHPG